jgi:hypothetical protein
MWLRVGLVYASSWIRGGCDGGCGLLYLSVHLSIHSSMLLRSYLPPSQTPSFCEFMGLVVNVYLMPTCAEKGCSVQYRTQTVVVVG